MSSEKRKHPEKSEDGNDRVTITLFGKSFVFPSIPEKPVSTLEVPAPEEEAVMQTATEMEYNTLQDVLLRKVQSKLLEKLNLSSLKDYDTVQAKLLSNGQIIFPPYRSAGVLTIEAFELISNPKTGTNWLDVSEVLSEEFKGKVQISVPDINGKYHIWVPKTPLPASVKPVSPRKKPIPTKKARAAHTPSPTISTDLVQIDWESKPFATAGKRLIGSPVPYFAVTTYDPKEMFHTKMEFKSTETSDRKIARLSLPEGTIVRIREEYNGDQTYYEVTKRGLEHISDQAAKKTMKSRFKP
jgi:hypothetical protein